MDKTSKRNILLHVLDGSLFMGGLVFFEASTIFVLFIKQISDNPIAISLIPALTMLGYNLPGFFSTRIAGNFRIRKKFLVSTALFQRLSLLLLVGSTFFITLLPPSAAVLIVLFSYFMFCFSGGIGAPAWLDLVAKTLPVTFRARTFAVRIFLASVAGIFFPILISFILVKIAFPVNYRISFFLGFVLIFISYICFIFIKEEKESPRQEKVEFSVYIKSLFQIIKQNPNFKRFLITRLLFAVTTWGTAFYTAYAIDTISGVTEQIVALYTLFLNISKAGASLVLGYLGDRFGNLLILQINSAVATSALIIATIFPSYFTFFIIYILLGIVISGNLNTTQVFITEFGDDKDRIIYTTIATAITGMFSSLIPLIGGLLLSFKVFEYKGLFTIAALFGGISLFYSLFMVKDPRKGFK